MLTQEKYLALKQGLEGRLILPEDGDYDSSRSVHNAMIDKRPVAIAYCKHIKDIRVCLKFARQNKLMLAVRCGGHNAGGLGVCDDGLVIDLSMINSVEVDKSSATVTVGGGCLLRDVDAKTQEFGMATPLGFFGGTGVGGLTLGGGIGYLTRHYGLTIDNLLGAELLLADGTLVTASAEENPDLFWAIRGGGGNFGIVVSFVFKLHPVQNVYGGLMLWNWEDSIEMMTWYYTCMETAPKNLYGIFALMTVPSAAPFPEALHGKKTCGVVWCDSGEPEAAAKTFDSIRTFKQPVLDWVSSMPFKAIQSMFDTMYPPGMHWYWKALFVNDLESTCNVHMKHGPLMPTPLSTMHIYPVNGAVYEKKNGDTAWNHRNAKYVLLILGIDELKNRSESIVKWARNYWDALQPYTLGSGYINFMMDEGTDAVKSNYGDHYEQLSKIKVKYDPENFFRVNQNIKPAADEPRSKSGNNF